MPAPKHRAPRRQPCAIGVSLSLALLTATACGSDANSGTTTDLGRALALVHGQGANSSVEFGRPKAALAASGGRAGSGPYGGLVGYGEAGLGPISMLVPKVLGFDPNDAEFAVTAGQPPKSGTLLSGLDTGSVKSRATALGAKVDGSTYRFRPDYGASFDDKLGTALSGGGIGLNVISTDGDDVRIASAEAGLELTSGGGDTLGSDSAFTGAAACLDDPLAAVLYSTIPPQDPRNSAGGDGPARTIGVAALGIGVTGSKGASPVEHLCVSADSDEHAATIASSIRSALQDGTSLTDHETWSALLKDGKVAVSGRTVSLTAHPANGLGGLLLRSLDHGDLPGLAG